MGNIGARDQSLGRNAAGVDAGATEVLALDDRDALFAVPGPLGAHAWDIVRDGPGHGPDDAAGLAVGPWGHVSVAGSEFADLQPRAFALRFYP